MSDPSIPQPNEARYEPKPRYHLFDPDGLPWTSRLSLGWLIVLFWVTGGMLAVPMGVYLGLWLKAKGRSQLVLVAYTLFAFFVAALFLPNLRPAWTDAVSLLMVVCWLLGAFLARHEIMQYYTAREGSAPDMSLLLTALLGVWYLNYRIRPAFPSRTTLS
jgi:hypothetical protein